MNSKPSGKDSESKNKPVVPVSSNNVPGQYPPVPSPGFIAPPGYPYHPYTTQWPNSAQLPYPLHQIPPTNTPNASFTPALGAASNTPWRKGPTVSNSIPLRPSYSTALSGAKVNVIQTSASSIKVPANKTNVASVPVSLSPSSKGSSVAPKEEWSSSMKSYVERAFLSCKTPAQRDVMEQLLRIKIKESIASERMNKINWELEPVPKYPVALDGKQINTANPPKLVIKQQGPKSAPISADERKRMDRAKRFDADQQEFKKQQAQNQMALQNVRIEDNQGDVIDWDEYTIVGTCQKLEKPYLRLTSAPDPATVRPLPVLRQTLKLLKDKWRVGTDYGYICDQFKSLRQDMTVQRIKSDFTVQVYEIHARIAIEQGDLGQYNQCQTQLKDLYSFGLSGSENEFLAYRLLYLIHCRNRQSINQFIGSLSEEQKLNDAVDHALKVRSAASLGNYSQLFLLYKNAPNMGAYLMDLFIPRERNIALNTILRAYRPNVSIQSISDILAFNSIEECKDWLYTEIGEFPRSNDTIDCKFYLTKLLSK